MKARCERPITVLLFSPTSSDSEAAGSRRGPSSPAPATATCTTVVAMEMPSLTEMVKASSRPERPPWRYSSTFRVTSLKVKVSPEQTRKEVEEEQEVFLLLQLSQEKHQVQFFFPDK